LTVAVKGPGVFPENNVVFLNMEFSADLLELQADLYSRFNSYVQLNEYDNPAKYHPHLTVWYQMTGQQYQRMKNFAFSRYKLPRYSGNNIRITLLRRGKILREYDVRSGRMMNRQEALRHH
jgi:2'-5' RNA ligase